MKKKMIALLAGALLTVALAGNAMAAFENFDLIRIAYQTAGGTAEVATDLGSLSSILSGTAVNSTSFITGGTGAGTAFSNTSLSNINVLYIAFDSNNISGTDKAWFSGAATAPGLISNNTWTTGPSSIQSYYRGMSQLLGNATQVVGSQGAANSYANLFGNGGGTQSDGSLGLLIDGTVEANLGAGAATQHLWYLADSTSPVFADLGTLITNLDGTTSFTSASQAAQTPIPPSLLLMGSGLLGMIGLRRKKA
jgi:hypothetical protein